MPAYDFHCEKCGEDFTRSMTFKEYDRKNIKCPKCHSTKVQPAIRSVTVKTSRKS